ncbi:MAG: hypothetical protein KKC39_07415 [Candidatus Omnitrophica bacterium]|nr:hypothetical protein [Candidatus Omnitrophota bacterium]MBU4468547.1 hypothetical protein [Candidatus Omnitrophota bacterium]MCG2707762.1 hypothetical protein [Candidatus Omnitrophota bacterium]
MEKQNLSRFSLKLLNKKEHYPWSGQIDMTRIRVYEFWRGGNLLGGRGIPAARLIWKFRGHNTYSGNSEKEG